MNFSRLFTRREKVLMILLVVLLLFAVYFFAVHRPVTEATEQIRTQSEELYAQIAVLQVKQARMQAMQKELDAVLAQSNAVQIPRYDNLDQVVAFLNAVLSSAEDYTLSFEGLESGGDTKILRRAMSLTFTCSSYELARDMVGQLQNCPYRCQMSVLSMTPAASSGARDDAQQLTSGAVTVSLRVTFFESNRD